MSASWKSRIKDLIVSTKLGRTIFSYRIPKEHRSHYLAALTYSRQTLKTIEDKGLYGVNAIDLKGQSGYEYFGGRIGGLLEGTLFGYLKYGTEAPNLLNPQKFSEFLILYKFFGRIPSPSPEDKVANEGYIPDSVLPLVTKHDRPFISDTNDVPSNDEIEAGTYMWKANHGWALHYQVTFPINEKTRTHMKDLAAKWHKTEGNARRGIWWNDLVERKVYLERHLGGGKEVRDWKFFVFGGRVEIVQVDTERFANHRQNIYDRDFASLPDELYFPRGEETEKPDGFGDMVEIAEGIGEQFEFIRVDFYCVDGKIYLGEIGIAPNASRQPVISVELDKRLGAAWPKGGVLRPKRA